MDVPIEQIVPHEQYVPNTKNQFHDIALIRMKNTVQFTDFIRPICLPRATHLRNLGSPTQKYIVAGWGKTEQHSRAVRLQKVYLLQYNWQSCSEAYRHKDITIGASQVCAGGTKGRDSCKGDSGSGLLAVDDSNLGQVYWYLAGVVSFGLSPCGVDGWPGVYTKVADYVDWIDSHL